MKDWEVIKTICEKLWDSEDNDCKLAEEYGFKQNIINLFIECYTLDDFCRWLAKNDCNPAKGFSEAEFAYLYDCDDEFEWAAICDDALFYNSEFAVVSW